MKTLSKLVFFVMAMNIATAASANNDSTIGGLLRACESGNFENIVDSWADGFCMGTFDTSLKYLLMLSRSSNVFELPESATVGQLMAVYIKWAKKKPELWHKASHLGVIEAVIEAFPKKSTG